MLSLKELRRAVPLLDARLAGHRLQAIVQPDALSVVLATYGGGSAGQSGRKHHLQLSCHPEFARVSLRERMPRALPTPPAFTQYLRAHVGNARIAGFRMRGDERELATGLRARDREFELLLAIFGRRSNLVLLDADARIVAAMRPLAETRPELSFGEPWTLPAARPPKSGDDRFREVSDERFLFAIEEEYAAALTRRDFARLQRTLEQSLSREAKALDRKLAKIEASLADAADAARLEREGELLKSVLSRVERGDRRVAARDFASGEEVQIALDPALSPSENLERLFKRYQKAVRSLAKAGAQQEKVRRARDEISALADELRRIASRGEAAGLAELEAFAERSEVRSLLGKRVPKAPPARPPSRSRQGRRLGGRALPNRLMPRRYRSAAGLEIWVGRSDEGNDHLTTRLARGNDLFFHLDGAPGSHVILRTEGRSDPPSEAILDACELAVHFSRAKQATRADVHVVPIKNVRKPKGAKRGLVTVHGGKTIHLRRMRTRLERILAARIDE